MLENLINIQINLNQRLDFYLAKPRENEYYDHCFEASRKRRKRNTEALVQP